MVGGFGVATIKTPEQKQILRGQKFKCGRHGELTAREISKLTGLSREGVWNRVRRGFRGEKLLLPKHESLRMPREACRNPVMVIAVKLASRFPDKVPTLKEIQATHPMCKRNAMRWRQALKDTRASACRA